MSLPESQRHIPEWAQRERARDLEWIGENVQIFWSAAQRGYKDLGRGALMTDTTTIVEHEKGASNPFTYLPHVEIEKHNWEDARRMVKEYDPTWEFVIILLKLQNRESAYRVGFRKAVKQ